MFLVFLVSPFFYYISKVSLLMYYQRANGTSTFNAITFDTNILGDANKYAVVNQYNLTVINAATSDDGTYRCTAATTDYDAILTVVGKRNGYRVLRFKNDLVHSFKAMLPKALQNSFRYLVNDHFSNTYISLMET